MGACIYNHVLCGCVETCVCFAGGRDQNEILNERAKKIQSTFMCTCLYLCLCVSGSRAYRVTSGSETTSAGRRYGQRKRKIKTVKEGGKAPPDEENWRNAELLDYHKDSKFKHKRDFFPFPKYTRGPALRIF